MKSEQLSGTAPVLALAVAAAAGLVFPSPAFGQAVSDRALSEVRADTVGDCTTLTITFNSRVQLLSAFPGGGRELHIRLKPLDKAGANRLRDTLRSPSTLPELRSIEYEGDNAAGPTLSLFFTQDMQFTVSAGQQPNTLIVQISKPGTKACSASSSGDSDITTQVDALPPGLYVINLASAPGGFDGLSEDRQKALAGRVVYESQFEKDSQQWYRLRAGFYETKEEATAELNRIKAQFPDAWVVKITPRERSQGIAASIAAPVLKPTTTAAPTATAMADPNAAAGTDVDATETARLTAEAEQAIQDNNLDRAIELLSTAAQKPQNANTPRAIELLGLTRERKGQNAHARAEYEEYLRRFPEGEGADRVKQRLAALDGASGSPSGTPLRAAGGLGGNGKWKWGLRGSFSQFYFRDQGRTSTLNTTSSLGTEVDNSVNVNQLMTSGDVTISGGNDRRLFQIRAAGSFTQNFGTSASITTINNGNEVLTYRSRPGGGIGAVTALYFDYTDNDLNSQLRLGRQTRNSAGVLGRFDGALVGWQPGKHLRINAVAGFPVLSSRQTHVLTERPFYGVSVDIGSKRSPVQTTLYWFDQRTTGGFVDRRSVGIEARFLKPNFNAYAMFDYDVKFGELNLGLVSMNYNFPDGSNLSLTGDYRRSPLLTTSNALIGQMDTINSLPFTDLTGLRPFFTDNEIYQMAIDRTLISKSLTLTYARPITKKLQINVDFSLTDTGGTPGTPATTGTPEIMALPSTGKEYFYGMQLIGSDLFMANDIYILSGRVANTSTAKVYSADFNARIPITSNFRLSPRLRYGYRDGKLTTMVLNPGTYSQFQPTIRLNFYPIKNSEIEIEFGGNFAQQSVFNGTGFDKISETGWVLSAGYRFDF